MCAMYYKPVNLIFLCVRNLKLQQQQQLRQLNRLKKKEKPKTPNCLCFIQWTKLVFDCQPRKKKDNKPIDYYFKTYINITRLLLVVKVVQKSDSPIFVVGIILISFFLCRELSEMSIIFGPVSVPINNRLKFAHLAIDLDAFLWL